MNLEDLGLNSMVVNLLKPALPKITAKILPMINEQIAKVLHESDNELQEGEAQSAVMIFKDKKNDVYLTIAKMSANDQIMRNTKPVLLREFFESLINNALNEQK